MKTQINKSQVMTRAHKIAKCIKTYQQPMAKYAALLADAMRQAWAEIRKAVAKAIAEAERLAEQVIINARRTNVTEDGSFMAGCANYYATTRHGQYMGD
jgi:hypothetical protein